MKQKIPGIQKITIIGLGLIGGSLAMALKNNVDAHIVGFSRKRQTVKKALQIGAIDKASFLPQKAVQNADIIFVCVPISEMRTTFVKITPHLKSGCIVTDVGSTKRQIVKWAKEALPAHITFIGGHPMAGSEKSGIDNAQADLFVGKPWCLVPSCAKITKDFCEVANRPQDSSGVTDSPGEASAKRGWAPPRWRDQKLIRLIKSIGAKPVIMSAAEHDRCVALVSHLPFIISTVLMQTAVESQEWKTAKTLASTGFASMTRLANGNKQMHQAILETNKENIFKAISQFEKKLALIKREIA